MEQQILAALEYYKSITAFNESIKNEYPRVDVGDIHLFIGLSYTINNEERWGITGFGFADRNEVAKQLNIIREALQEYPKLKETIQDLTFQLKEKRHTTEILK